MSKYYNPHRKLEACFQPGDDKPFRLSRTKISDFLNCPRCFYIDRRLGVGHPPGYPFSLNSAVDELLKKEFDIHRANGTTHPLMETYGIDAVPLAHEKMDEWRDSRTRGVTYLHEATNFLVTGGVDDVWVDRDGQLIIVDYKATSKNSEVNLDEEWQIGYKRQMEIYQWLFRMNGFAVSDTGYFVYCNGHTDREAFDGKLEFDVKLIPYTGTTDWVEKVLFQAKECLMSDEIPQSGDDCDWCKYVEAVKEL